MIKEAYASFDLDNSNVFNNNTLDDPESDGCDKSSDEGKELLSDVDASIDSDSSVSHINMHHCRSTLEVYLK